VTFKYIFREFEAFFKISILFEDILREDEAFFFNVRDFKRLRGFLNTFFSEISAFFKECEVFQKNPRLF
jgi:hypothetical protein